jgi:hypothetical protein
MNSLGSSKTFLRDSSSSSLNLATKSFLLPKPFLAKSLGVISLNFLESYSNYFFACFSSSVSLSDGVSS